MDHQSRDYEIRQGVAKARGLQEFSDALVRPILGLAQEAMTDAGALFAEGIVLRGMVHLRPEGGYRSLVLVRGGGEAEDLSPTVMSGLSEMSSVWKAIGDVDAPIAYDAGAGSFKVLSRSGSRSATGAAENGHHIKGPGAHTRQDLHARQVTHLLAVPLHARAGVVGGMLTVEVNCIGAIGLDFAPWHRCMRDIERLLRDYEAAIFRVPQEYSSADDIGPVAAEGPMRAALSNLRLFALCDETILLTGETGAGKTHLTRLVHLWSRRRHRRRVVVDLSTVPETLKEGVLFGWKKGAFSGAHQDHKGYIAEAEGGTLFLDEVDKLSLETQPKLMTLLDTRRYRPLGHDVELVADVRFIVATNINLEKAVAEGRFLHDLYWRICGLRVDVPPLRERRGEITKWARHMLDAAHHAAVLNGVLHVDDSSLAPLLAHSWPGNLRELRSTLLRAYLFAVGDAMGGAITYPDEVRVERTHVLRALNGQPILNEHPVLLALEAAATAVVDEAARRWAAGLPPLPLELVDNLKHLVLMRATERTSWSRDEALEALGKGNWVRFRQGMAELRKARQAFEKLRELLGTSGTRLPTKGEKP